MLLHYIATAWRHMLKYKTQNVISILCLAVGVVCFALTIQAVLTAATIRYARQTNTDTHIVQIVHDISTQYMRAPDSTLIAQIYQHRLPSVREVDFWYRPLGVNFNFEDATSLPKTCLCSFNNVPPRMFLRYNMHSAITGEPIPELDEGDVIISDDIRDKVYGKGTDPRGFRILCEIDGGVRTIRDVVPATIATSEYGGSIFYISRIPITSHGLSSPGRSYNILNVEANNGYDADALVRELGNVFPGHKFIPYKTADRPVDTDIIFVIALYAIVVLIGGSVLVVGVSGYLKMQTQLFALRSREIALRRTLGARPWQLFMLLATETVVAFVFTALAANLFTALLTPYILQPFTTTLQLNLSFSHELRQFHCIQWCVLLGTMAVTLCMAAWMVRRQLHEQVSTRVGRSGHPRTKGQSLMLCMQFVTSMVLFAVTLWGYRGLSVNDDDWYYVMTPNASGAPNYAPYRHAMTINKQMAEHLIPGFADSLHAIRGIVHTSRVRYGLHETTEPDTALILHHDTVHSRDTSGQTIFQYSMMASDEELVDMLGLSISPTPYRDNIQWNFATAIYARNEDAERLRTKWHLPAITDAPTRTLHGQQTYALLGYAPCPRGYQKTVIWQPTPSYWLIDNDSQQDGFHQERNHDALSVYDNYFIFSNGWQYDRVEKKVQAMLQEADPGNRNRPAVQNVYEKWFAERHLMDMLRSICFLPVLISILCIIAGVYSAISLECRGRQKEIALRKIHGARSRDIMHMMGSYYLRLLIASGIITTVLIAGATGMLLCMGVPIDYGMHGITLLFVSASFIAVTAVTLLTIWHKIRTVSQLNAADIIAKE